MHISDVAGPDVVIASTSNPRSASPLHTITFSGEQSKKAGIKNKMLFLMHVEKDGRIILTPKTLTLE